jgi:hypothetical protein
MTVPVQDPLVSYTGDGTTAGPFTVPFRILVADDLTVLSNGVIVAQSAYTIAGLGEDEATVTFVAAPALGVQIIMFRAVALERLKDYQYNGDLRSDTVNADFDRIWMAMQDTSGTATRAIRYPVTEYGTSGELPDAADRIKTLLAFDANGNQTLVPMGATVGAGDLTTDTFVAGTDFTPGTATSVTLSRTYGTTANLFVFFDAAFQGPDQIASLVGNVLTFTAPIPVGVQNVYVKGGTTLSIDIPPLQSIIDSMLAAGTKVKNRADLILDVRDFPMLGGSYQDDTTAVEDAFNLALQTGRPVQLPFDRDVYITRPIELRPQSAPSTYTGQVGIHTSRANAILLRGQGGRAIKAAPNFVGDHMLQLIFNSDHAWIAPQWSGMEDFILDGGGIVDTALISNYCMNVQMRRMRVTGTGNGFKWIGYGVASIDRCMFFVGTALDFSQGGGDSFIENCDFYPTYRGVVIGPSGANFSLRDCVFTRQDADFPVGSAPIAIASTITTDEIRDLRVRNCEFSGMQYGVSFSGSGGQTVKRIVIEGCHTTPSAGGALWTGALAYLENVQEGDISGNFVGYPSNPPTNGTPLAGVALVSSKNVGVRGNQFSYLTGPSVNGTNCSGLNISDNRLSNVAMAGSGNTAIYLNSVTNSVVSLNSAQKTEASAGATFITELGTSTANKGVGNNPSGFTTFATLAGGSTSSYS